MVPNERKYYLWNELVVNSQFETEAFEITKEKVKRYVLAVQDDTAIYREEQAAAEHGFKQLIAPPTFAAVFLRDCFHMLPSPPGGIHAKQKFEFIKPAMVGDIITTYAVIADKYIKRDKKYVEMVTETYNQKRELIVKGWMTRIWAK